MNLADHPTARHLAANPRPPAPTEVDGAWLLAAAQAAGADDVSVIGLDHPALVDEAGPIRAALPSAEALVPFVVRMARAPVRAPTRSVSNGEFHRASARADAVGDALVHALEARGVPALYPSVGFPMEMDRFPGRTWVVSHKVVAEAAGLGRMGVHRNLIHPQFGSYVLLGTVIVGRPAVAAPRTLDFNPCADCRLCVAACPVGAIRADGFDFSACLTHNYREFMGGFSDWVGTVTESRDRWAYRDAVGQAETASWWQSLTSGPHYKAAYCVAACPAGADVLVEFLADKKRFVAENVEPLRAKVEPVYVMPDTDAEAHVRARYPHKQVRRVEGGLYVASIEGFLQSATLVFQARKMKDQRFSVAFRFTGAQAAEATFTVADGRLTVGRELLADADCTVTIDGGLWVDVLAGRKNPVWLVMTGRMRTTGDRSALDRFQRAFPGRV